MKRLRDKIGRHYHAHFYDEVWRVGIYLLWPCKGKILDDYTASDYASRTFGFPLSKPTSPCQARCVEILNRGSVSDILIYIREWTGSSRDWSAVCHECFHATEFVLNARGIHHSNETSETFAYTLESFVRRCGEVLCLL